MREYGYLEKMLDMLTDPYTHRDLQNVRKNRKLETNIGKLFSLLSPLFVVLEVVMEVVIPILMAKLIDDGIDGSGGMDAVMHLSLIHI